MATEITHKHRGWENNHITICSGWITVHDFIQIFFSMLVFKTIPQVTEQSDPITFLIDENIPFQGNKTSKKKE